MRKLSSTTIVAAAIFIALAGVVMWQWYQNKQEAVTLQQNRDFVSFDTASVTEIAITQGENTVTVKKENDTWVIASQENAAADATKVDALLNALNNALIQATVSQSGSQAETYGLSDAERIRITLTASGATVLEIDVGKAGSVARTWYGRNSNETAIYLLSGSRSSFANTEWAKSAEESAEMEIETE